MNKNNKPSEPVSTDLEVAENLTYHNHTTWCRMMHINIKSRGMLNHLTNQTSGYYKFILPTMESKGIVNQFLDYTTARDLWKGIENLLSDDSDELQIFNQRDSIEAFYSKLQDIWKEIDRRMPNPMKHAEDITLFNTFIQTQKFFQFLAGVNDSIDKDHRNLLNQDPLPTLDKAFATIRREIVRRGIITGASSSRTSPSEIGSRLIAKHRSDFTSFR